MLFIWIRWFFWHFVSKLKLIAWRILDLFRLLPIRVYRFFRHFMSGLGWKWTSPYGSTLALGSKSIGIRIYFWFLLNIIYVLEIFGVGELYETVLDLLKFNTRSLNEKELRVAQSIYGEELNYGRIRIDDHSYLGPKQQKFCYVSFYLINSWGKMQDDLLIHELMHIWQYERMGAAYMIKALVAQHSDMGYDYGGVAALKMAVYLNRSFFDFNAEQQGDIISDYWRIKHGLRPQWGSGTFKDILVYETILQPVLAPIKERA